MDALVMVLASWVYWFIGILPLVFAWFFIRSIIVSALKRFDRYKSINCSKKDA